MYNNRVTDIREEFKSKLACNEFTEDRLGSKTIEIIGASFIADEEAIFGTPNKEYIKAELDWYLKQSTNINDIIYDTRPPEAWKHAANKHGEINSNYGLLIFGDKFYSQYNQALVELKVNPDSRRACMIYNRPSIWVEYNEHGKSDFICTNAVTYYIRDNKLNCVVQMRSNDAVFGYKNDYAWQKFVLELLVSSLKINYAELEVGTITWQVQNLHVYSRHFHLVS